MIKYIINCNKESISVMEVEGEVISALDNPSIMWLPEDEYLFKVTSPNSILEKKIVGKETKYFPVVWHSHNFCDTVESAKIKAQAMLESTRKLYKEKNRECLIYIEEVV